MKIVSVGECMLEFSPAGDSLYRRGFAGDTFNTAWYLRQQLPAEWTVAYATAVGTDAVSDELVAFLAGEGIDTGAIARVPERTLGLYMIALHEGERTFTYWRSQAAARLLARDEAALEAALAGADLVVFSGITVAIVEHRDALLAALSAVRARGGKIVFDPNIRPRLWPDAGAMRREIERAAAVADIVLPSFDDETTHFGDATPRDTLHRYRDLGASSVVVKNGSAPMLGWAAGEGEAEAMPATVPVVDTTAAGDSFNAGFLAGRLAGDPLGEAMRRGAALAGVVVGARGALVEAARARAASPR